MNSFLSPCFQFVAPGVHFLHQVLMVLTSTLSLSPGFLLQSSQKTCLTWPLKLTHYMPAILPELLMSSVCSVEFKQSI